MKNFKLFAALRRQLTGAVALDFLLMTVGSLLWAVVINALIKPNGYLSGGFTGVALIINYFVPLSIGIAVFIMNIPALIWALKELNKRFLAYTVYCVVIQSVLIDVTAHIPAYTGDTLLAAIFAGLLGGISGGIIIRRRGSSGGLDIIGIIIKEKFGFSVGTVGNAFNITMIVVASFLFGLEIAMYTIIYILCCNFALDRTIAGLGKKYSAMILTTKPAEIKQVIFENTYRGVTLLRGEGAFSGVEKTILYCVLNQFDLAQIKDIVRRADPDAMITVSESIDVYGKINSHRAVKSRDVEKN